MKKEKVRPKDQGTEYPQSTFDSIERMMKITSLTILLLAILFFITLILKK
jgi:hypothetical protein